MADDLLLAQYPKQQTVRDRNYSALVIWADGITTEPLPPEKPDEEYVRQRLVAERIPTATDSYVTRTMSFMMQSDVTQTNIRQFLSAWNDEATEVSLSAQNAGIIADFMPRFAMTDVTQPQVDQWYLDHYGEPVATPTVHVGPPGRHR
jgi:hypothetical protein